MIEFANGIKLEPGVYIDSAAGHEHIRQVLANLVEEYAPDLASELRGAPSPDLSEEDDALDVLNQMTRGGVWSFHNGDIILEKEGSDD